MARITSREQALDSGINQLESAVTRAVDSNLPILPDDDRLLIWRALENRPNERRAYLSQLAQRHNDTRSIDELDSLYVRDSTEEFGGGNA